jgi:alginate O-acetyltransferase complex protein AlgI
MLFNSWVFAVFLAVVFGGYHFGPRFLRGSATGQAIWLTVCSYVFYAWQNPRLVLLLVFACTVNAVAAQRLLEPGRDAGARRRTLLAALGVNLAALAFFKYAALLAALVLPASVWASVQPWLAGIPLPVGISFFTFQGISLVVDSWRAGAAGFAGLHAAADRAGTRWFHVKVWFFKAFFPQLVAGPIVKAGEFFHQIGRKRLADVDWDAAAKKLVADFFLKMVVADNLKEATAALSYPAFLALPKINLVAMLYGFSCQIYADFCGYSLIAMGLAHLFGYRLPINFQHPYLSRSITEFWRRWHLSLSSWLREYLYFPLGGNRRGRVRTYLNLFVVMFLGGLWHGAAWSYAIWGSAHGLFLGVERLLGIARDRRAPKPLDLGGLVGIFITFNLVSALWLLFKLPNFEHVLAYIRCLAHNPGGAQPQALFVVALFSTAVILQHVWAANAITVARAKNLLGPRSCGWLEAGFYATLAVAILVNAGPAGEFIYFQF